MVTKIVQGTNDLATTHPELLEEWDYEVNTKNPENLVAGSVYKAHWVCSKNHKWTTAVRHRSQKKYGCPYCGRQKPIIGENDLATLYPELAKEWSPKNPQSASEFLPFSGKKVKWICVKQHEWEAVIGMRTSRGNGCPVCSGRVIQPGNSIASNSELMKEWDSDKNSSDPTTVGLGIAQKSYYWKCSKGHEWKTSPYNRKQGKNCPQCGQHGSSRVERELQAYVKSIVPSGMQVLLNSRQQITPFELDIYIPELKIAIEFNGLYWHSSLRQKDKNYHVKKRDKCEGQGIRLLQVWEDDWRDKPEVVKSLLARKLGFSQEAKVNAREGIVCEIDRCAAQSFLNDHHIQGYKSGSFYLGLEVAGELVCVLSGTRFKDHWTIDRFASNCLVRGGFGKLLKYLRSTTDLPLVTFADREISDGDLYERLGFREDKVLSADYSYLYQDKRHHKFGFRKKRFENDPELLFDPKLCERDLAELNGIPRIYDSGKIRYVLERNE